MWHRLFIPGILLASVCYLSIRYAVRTRLDHDTDARRVRYPDKITPDQLEWGVPYDQFLLFGDSLTQRALRQEQSFGFALQEGALIILTQGRAEIDTWLLRPWEKIHWLTSS